MTLLLFKFSFLHLFFPRVHEAQGTVNLSIGPEHPTLGKMKRLNKKTKIYQLTGCLTQCQVVISIPVNILQCYIKLLYNN
jgi:hypothetical protein